MKKFLVVLGVLVLVFSMVGVASAYSAADHVYQLIDTGPMGWSDARTAVQALGPDWDLATITSQEERDFIVTHVLSGISGEYWLGGYQASYHAGQQPDDEWSWVTGEIWNYTNWNPPEPNDGNGLGLEQYLAIGQGGGQWQWNDEGYIGNIHGYIAEKVVPEPGTILLLGAGLVGLAGLRRKLVK